MEASVPDVDLIVDANMPRDYRGAADIARRYRDAVVRSAISLSQQM